MLFAARHFSGNAFPIPQKTFSFVFPYKQHAAYLKIRPDKGILSDMNDGEKYVPE